MDDWHLAVFSQQRILPVTHFIREFIALFVTTSLRRHWQLELFWGACLGDRVPVLAGSSSILLHWHEIEGEVATAASIRKIDGEGQCAPEKRPCRVAGRKWPALVS